MNFDLLLIVNGAARTLTSYTHQGRLLDHKVILFNYVHFQEELPYFEQMVGQIYPTELQLNKANSSDTEAPFLDLNLSITNGIVSSKIYDKRDDFNFEFPIS